MPADAEIEPVAAMDDTVDPKTQENLGPLVPGSYCRHRSWGVGKIVTKDDALRSLTIDFRSKKGHPMEFGYAAQSLKSLGNDHLEARILQEPEAVREMAAKQPGEVMKLAIQSLGREANTTRLEEAFVPHLYKAEEWKKFWEAAKRAMKKDPKFVLPSRRVDPVQYLESAPQSKAGGLEELREAVEPNESWRLWRSYRNHAVPPS